MKPLIFSFAVLIVIPTVAKAMANVPVAQFDINYVVLTSSPNAEAAITVSSFEEVTERLNHYFVDAEGNSVVNFRNKGVHFYNDIQTSNCPLVIFGDQKAKPKRKEVYKAFENCPDVSIKDPKAINFYVFDRTGDSNDPWPNSYAFFNWFRKPFVMVNWKMVQSHIKMTDVHEIGHIFGLTHVPACGAIDSVPTNVMTGLMDFCEGTVGNRQLGFSEWQFAVMKLTAPIIADSFR